MSSRSIAITLWNALCSQHFEYGSNYGYVTSIYGNLPGPGLQHPSLQCFVTFAYKEEL